MRRYLLLFAYCPYGAKRPKSIQHRIYLGLKQIHYLELILLKLSNLRAYFHQNEAFHNTRRSVGLGQNLLFALRLICMLNKKKYHFHIQYR